MNPASTDPLSQLRDIHLPAPVVWWPPAPGWWLLGCLGLALLVLLAWQLRRYWQSRQYRRSALQLWRQISAASECPLIRLQRLNQLLKRTALSAYPQLPVAGLHGSAWVAFLRQTAPGVRITPAVETLLGRDVYAPQLAQDAAVDPACDFVRQWIRHHLPARRLKPLDLTKQDFTKQDNLQCGIEQRDIEQKDPAPAKPASGGASC